MGLIFVAQPATMARQIAVASNGNALFRIFFLLWNHVSIPDQLFLHAIFLCLALGPSRPDRHNAPNVEMRPLFFP
jgi:hypothetical protein